MIVTVAWIALLATGSLMELGSHLRRRPGTSLARVAAVIGRRLPGRLFLILLWAFVGWHFFARYTRPR